MTCKMMAVHSLTEEGGQPSYGPSWGIVLGSN